MSAGADPFSELVGPEIEDEPGTQDAPSDAQESPEPDSAPAGAEDSAPAGDEPEAASGDAGDAPRGEEGAGEPAEGGAPAVEAAPEKPKGELPRSVIAELQKLRKANRELRQQAAEDRSLQAPIPGQGVAGAPPASPQPGTFPEGAPLPAPQQRIPTVVGEDGQEYVDPQAIEAYIAQREAARAPSPQQMVAQGLQQARLQFVAEDPDRNGPASMRVDNASQMLDSLTDQAAQALGYQPRDLNEWEAALATTGGLAQFREHFPEIQDAKRFAHAVIASRNGDVQTLRFWMDDYMQTGYSAFESSLTGEQPSVDQGGAPATVPASAPSEPSPSAAKLSPGRPRSMANKGTTGTVDEGLEGELKALEDEVGSDPMGVDPDSEKKHARLAEIRKKLKLD